VDILGLVKLILRLVLDVRGMIGMETTEKKLRMALYCRVSTHSQTTENQVLKLEDYANREGWDYITFEEEETTRKTRPIKQEVLMALRRKQFDGVCIWRLDRWARSTTELILEIKEMHDKGIIFKSLSDNIDFSTPAGKLQFHILAAFAEFERNLISERTKEGLARAKMKGRKLGRPNGATDTKKRKRSGYILRDARVLQQRDERMKVFRPVDHYIDNYKESKREIKKKQHSLIIEG